MFSTLDYGSCHIAEVSEFSSAIQAFNYSLQEKHRARQASWPVVQVAVALTKDDVVKAHARDELGIDIDDLANPWQVMSCPIYSQDVLGQIQPSDRIPGQSSKRSRKPP